MKKFALNNLVFVTAIHARKNIFFVTLITLRTTKNIRINITSNANHEAPRNTENMPEIIL